MRKYYLISAEDECCFRYGFGSRMKPCCLNVITCEEHGRFVHENATHLILGGAFGKHHYCPENAEIANQILSGTLNFEHLKILLIDNLSR